tara:strand:+ start:132 stop:350 length:219 start_codon:yes stop_codon:yes gene_type:complete
MKTRPPMGAGFFARVRDMPGQLNAAGALPSISLPSKKVTEGGSMGRAYIQMSEHLMKHGKHSASGLFTPALP